ncbi:GNAT family N-acetyltransferase [uncultured Robinsoniella sp.]|uniref:GNAT family N-acetyltransferase n=1 Tax=uncultured Robinsoniella sp. TaxID=904190 RepID=UPI00374FD68F
MYCKDNTSGSITVNSSPFAVPAYHHLGFTDTGSKKVTNGLRYTTMVISLDHIHIVKGRITV